MRNTASISIPWPSANHLSLTCGRMVAMQGLLGIHPEAATGEAAEDRRQPRQRLPDSELQKRLASRWNPRIAGSTTL